MTKGRTVPAVEHVTAPIRLFDRVRKAYGLPDMPVIVADQIATQIDALPGENDSYTPPAESYGTVAPPFARCFIEAATQNEAASHLVNGKRIVVPAGTTYRGVACYDVRGTQLDQTVISPHHRRRIPDGTRWIVAMWGYLWFSGTRELLTFPGPKAPTGDLHVALAAATEMRFEVAVPPGSDDDGLISAICTVAPAIMRVDAALMELYDGTETEINRADVRAIDAFMTTYRPYISNASVGLSQFEGLER